MEIPVNYFAPSTALSDVSVLVGFRAYNLVYTTFMFLLLLPFFVDILFVSYP